MAWEAAMLETLIKQKTNDSFSEILVQSSFLWINFAEEVGYDNDSYPIP